MRTRCVQRYAFWACAAEIINHRKNEALFIDERTGEEVLFFFGHSITVDIQVSLARNSSFVVNNKFMEIHVELISALVAFPDAINTREAVAKSIWSCETGFEWRRDGCFGSCGVGDCGATSLLIVLKFKKQIARFSTVIESHWQHWL